MVVSQKAALNSTDVASSSIRCPVCKSPSYTDRKVPGWGEWRRCSVCTLEFVNPFRLGEDPRAMFDRAYKGQVQASGMLEFGRRVDQRRVILTKLNDPTLWFWTPAFGEVLAWVKSHVPPGGTVLELGCGLGFFLHALRNAGFQAVGLDVAQTAIELSRQDGFKVWHGPLESMPAEWVVPDAVVSMFMLHHLEDPAAFLGQISARWPHTPLALTIYGPTNLKFPESEPPRTLTHWNSRALSTAFRQAGYDVTVQELQSTGSEWYLIATIRGTLARMIQFPQVYRFGKRIESLVLPKLPFGVRHDAWVLVAFGSSVNSAARPGEERQWDRSGEA